MLSWDLKKGQRYIASVYHIISLIGFRKPFTQSKCTNCIGIQNNKEIVSRLYKNRHFETSHAELWVI